MLYIQTKMPDDDPRFPVGMLHMCPSELSLPCDGSTVSQKDFPELFDVLSYAYGLSEPGTFKLPDYRGMFSLR